MSLERKLARGFVKALGQMERERQRQANARAKEQARQEREHQKRLRAYERELIQAEKQAEREAIMATTAAAMQRAACLLYTSPSPRDQRGSRMPSSA